MNECLICGDVAIHFPIAHDNWIPVGDPYCGYCFHGVDMTYAAEIEGCEECANALGLELV